MKLDEKIEAILHIRPNAQFTLHGENLEWLDSKQPEPTETEIEAGWIAYQAKIAQDKKTAENAKATAEAKLAVLGLTVDDLKALGLG